MTILEKVPGPMLALKESLEELSFRAVRKWRDDGSGRSNERTQSGLDRVPLAAYIPS